ncbi:MAG: response regulator [Campylobacterota bacterium]|nr:response regulator [Campylobacterota bacterium]
MNNYYNDILKKCTVLVVDDEDKIRSKFKQALELYVENVIEASNGEDALDLFYKEKPQIVITDVKMPIMDGLMLTTIIRKANDKIPIVIVSAHSNKELLLNFISLNLVEYLIKPIDFEQLKEVLYKCSKIVDKNGLIEVKITDSCFYSYPNKSLLIENNTIQLSPKEIKLIELLIENRNKLVSKDLIEQTVYEFDQMSESALNNLVLKARKKIGNSRSIVSISGLGFMMPE